MMCGCASVLSGNRQDVEITASVDSVDVYRGGEYLGKTPFVANLSRQMTEPLIFRKEGYRSLKAQVKTKINPHVWWNVPFTILGTTGMSTDYGSGSFYQISPQRIFVRMKPMNFKSQQESDTEELEIFEIFGAENIRKERSRHQVGSWVETHQLLEAEQEEP